VWCDEGEATTTTAITREQEQEEEQMKKGGKTQHNTTQHNATQHNTTQHTTHHIIDARVGLHRQWLIPPTVGLLYCSHCLPLLWLSLASLRH
jgi:ABC-type nickel/cobalt efflux system permease component RcnA